LKAPSTIHSSPESTSGRRRAESGSRVHVRRGRRTIIDCSKATTITHDDNYNHLTKEKAKISKDRNYQGSAAGSKLKQGLDTVKG